MREHPQHSSKYFPITSIYSKDSRVWCWTGYDNCIFILSWFTSNTSLVSLFQASSCSDDEPDMSEDRLQGLLDADEDERAELTTRSSSLSRNEAAALAEDSIHGL